MAEAEKKLAEEQQQEEAASLYSGVARLARSSIAIVVGLAVIGTIVMNVLGKIDGATAINAILVLVGLLAGKTALEDGAEKLGARMHETRSSSLARAAEVLVPMVKEFLPRPGPELVGRSGDVLPFSPPSQRPGPGGSKPPDKSS
jgi:hypothetical protein